jgi:integrase
MPCDWRRRVFDGALERAGPGDRTAHELRYTAAGPAVAADATIGAVQRMLGHASAAMTLDLDSGLFGGDLVADRLDAVQPPPSTHASRASIRRSR